MIASLTGTVTARDAKSLVIDIGGVGFRVYVIPAMVTTATVGSRLQLETYLSVREDALELFGFATDQERRLFERLLTVSGVGPRVAIGVMSAAAVGDLERAIDRGEASVLTAVSGVGAKIAQRIIIELRGKLADGSELADDALTAVIDALTQLGYSAREARDAATKTPTEGSIEERIRAALRQFGKGR